MMNSLIQRDLRLGRSDLVVNAFQGLWFGRVTIYSSTGGGDSSSSSVVMNPEQLRELGRSCLEVADAIDSAQDIKNRGVK